MKETCPVCGSECIGFGGDFRYCMDCLTNIDLEKAKDYIWATNLKKYEDILRGRYK